MTNTSESKVSRLIARSIIQPENRAAMLALATPIYCPDYNGIQADKLTIIYPNPLVNTVETTTIKQTNGTEDTRETQTVANYGTVGGKKTIEIIQNHIDLSSGTIHYLEGLFNQGQTIDFDSAFTVQINYTVPASATGAIQLSTFNYDEEDDTDKLYTNSFVINNTILTGDSGEITSGELKVGSNASNGRNILSGTVDVGDVIEMIFTYNPTSKDFHLKATNTTKNIIMFDDIRPGATADGVKPTADSQDSSNYVINNTTDYTATSSLIDYTVESVSVSYNDNTSTNQVTIALDKSLEFSYDVPYNIDLTSIVDIQDLIISDMQAKFKKAVSDEVEAMVEAGYTARNSVTYTEGEIADAIAKVYAEVAEKGTARKFSILNYSNGAPVEYMFTSDEPNVADNIKNEEFSSQTYASLNDRDTAAKYYISNPSLVATKDFYTQVQKALLDGSLKSYFVQRTNVDLSPLSKITDENKLAIFGTNDAVAVGFTEPKISIERNTDSFTKTVTIQIFYGAVLIHPENIVIIKKQSA